MIMPYSIMSFGSIGTDRSKKITAGVEYSYGLSGNNSASDYQIEPGFTIRPLNSLKFGLSTFYEVNNDKLQYVSTVDYSNEKRYILGTIDQKTFGLTFRVDLNLTPEFSIQYYGSPFISRAAILSLSGLLIQIQKTMMTGLKFSVTRYSLTGSIYWMRIMT